MEVCYCVMRPVTQCDNHCLILVHRFQPFTRKTYAYEPLLHGTSKYGHLPYGHKFFRHEYVDKFVIPKVRNSHNYDLQVEYKSMCKCITVNAKVLTFGKI